LNFKKSVTFQFTLNSGLAHKLYCVPVIRSQTVLALF